MSIIIRPQNSTDCAAIRLVNENAFGGTGEANVIEALRERGQVTFSFVAEVENRIAGHILFSPVTLETKHGSFGGLSLAPLAVLPEFQRRGIGAQLARAGLDECRRLNCAFVVVLGHPDYYPRFGFERASKYGLRCEWEVPDPAFMVIELLPGALTNRAGLVKYQPEWSSV
ncbi:MAG: GNAT family N-acetyltransferase [Anaerolineales bacterium]